MIPGDPAAVEAGANSLLAAANAFGSASDSASADSKSATAEWEGEAALGAYSALVDLAKRTEIGVEICRMVAVVLQDYAAELRTAQIEWLAGQSQLRVAQQQQDANPDPLHLGTSALLDTASPVNAIKAAIAAAEARAHDANARAAGLVEALVGGLQELAPTPPPPVPATPEGDHHGTASSIIHTALDVAGLVPVIGEPADGVNALYYAAQNDYVDAGLSAAAMVPLGGAVATGGKLTRKTVRAAKPTREEVDAAIAAAKASERIAPAATVGHTTNFKWRETFKAANPGVDIDQMVVHHAVERDVLRRYADRFTPNQIHSLENLRGFDKGQMNFRVHLSALRTEWNAFYDAHPNATRQELLDFATKMDGRYGHLMNPTVGG